MKSNFQVLLLALIYLLANVTDHSAQEEIAFENLSIPDGLSSNIVFKVFEDRFGILWIGTTEGINRYDGYTMKSYKNDPDDPNSLIGNQILEIIEDRDGYIWIGSGSGISRFDRNTEQFENFMIDSSATSQESQQAHTLVEDDRGNIWIGAISRSVKRFDKDKNRIVDIEPKLESGEDLGIPAIGGIVKGHDNRIYFGFFTYGFAAFNYEGEYFELLECTHPEYESLFENNFSIGLTIDQNNNLWTTAGNGVVGYNVDDKSLKIVELPGYTHGIRNVTAFKLRVLENNELWIGTNGSGLFRYKIDEDELSIYTQDGTNDNSLQSNAVFDIIRDSFGDIWISTLGGGLAKYNVDKEPFSLIKIPTDSQSGQNFKQVNSVLPLSDSKILLGTGQGFYSVSGKADELNKVFMSDNNINSIYLKSDDIVWLATEDKLKAFSLRNNRQIKSAAVDRINNDLKTLFARQIFEDASGNVWIVSSGTLLQLNNQGEKIRTFDTKNRRAYSEKLMSEIQKIAAKEKPLEQILQVGEDQRLLQNFNLNKKSKLLVVAAGEGTNQPELFDFGWITDAVGDTVWTLEDYMTTFHLGGALKNRLAIDIIELDPGEYALHYQSDIGHSYGNWNEEAAPDSNLWGIQVFETSGISEQTMNMVSAENNKTFVDATIIMRITQSRAGDYWLSTNEGIIKLEKDKFETTKYSTSFFGDRSFISDITRDIVEDNEGMLWIATQGGLIRFDPQSETAVSLTTEDGIPSSQLVSVLEDDFGNLWLGSLNGLTKFDKSSIDSQPYFVNYDVKDGLQGYFFNVGAAYKSSSGKLYFGGRNGLNSFFPGKINKIPPKVVIDGFYISNNYVTTVSENSPLTHNILETEEITLPYSQNDISFSFAAIHYLRPERNKLAYRMEGLDTGWVYDNRRYAAFTNLDPGEYKFKVKGANSDGIWNEGVKEIAITVLPPWYRTTLAYIFYGLAFIAAFITFDRVQRNRILAKEREKQRIQEAELRAVAAEAEAKVIQAENERKTKELEEARELQLSMLPVELPNLPHLDIAVYMKTATEVGGDYYDFHIGMDGTLTCVIGDATGHGLNAGTMVTATKSLFSTHASNPDILFTFNEISRCLKEMRLRLLSMCLMIAKIKGNELTISTAGMPPALLYRADTKKVEELLIKGMPLGAPAAIPYEVKKATLNSGDTLLLLSDGFPELFNSKKEMYGYDRVIETFNKYAHKGAEEIIDSLKDEGSNYVEDRDPDDDVTFVVIKVK